MHPGTLFTVLFLTAAVVAAPVAASPQRTEPPNTPRREPPNAPATLAKRGDRITLTYDGRVILRGDLIGAGSSTDFRSLVDSADGVVTQVLKWTARDGARLTLKATIDASGEAFACELEPRADALPMVRNSSGASWNRLNRAVYDRQGDWALSADVQASVRIAPTTEGADSTAFSYEVSGREIALRFQPRFFQKHRGLRYFRPRTYRPWHESVAGWTSWYAFLDKVTEQDIKRTADVVSEVLAPFGFEYLQIDDGYQQSPVGQPKSWLGTNAKFPSGLAGLRDYINGRGLKPGIWTNASFEDSAYVRAHPAQFVASPQREPAYGNWIGFVMDASNAATRHDLVRPVYDSLAGMGWRYVKLDALRHLRYEGYNSFADDFRRRGLDRADVFRTFVKTVRDALGVRTFLLACWGIRPELVGLVDAVRVGTDGFGYGGFSQYNSFNNVVWRNDPDHIELRQPDAFRATSLTSLTGSLLMLTDQPELYRTERVEAAKRAVPVLFTLPEQLYDVDPSRSSRLARADVEVSGSGPRPLDADRQLGVPLYLLDLSRPFERWSVLARANNDISRVRFADLGLNGESEQIVFEFWSKTLIGSFRDEFVPGPIDPKFAVQVFCIRARESHPQLVATSRHVTCGGTDLVHVEWSGETLSGQSDIVANDGYDLYLTEPPGFRFRDASAEGAEISGSSMEGLMRVVHLRAAKTSRVSWRVRWERA